jgi:endonuclease III
MEPMGCDVLVGCDRESRDFNKGFLTCMWDKTEYLQKYRSESDKAKGRIKKMALYKLVWEVITWWRAAHPKARFLIRRKKDTVLSDMVSIQKGVAHMLQHRLKMLGKKKTKPSWMMRKVEMQLPVDRWFRIGEHERLFTHSPLTVAEQTALSQVRKNKHFGEKRRSERKLEHGEEHLNKDQSAIEAALDWKQWTGKRATRFEEWRDFCGCDKAVAKMMKEVADLEKLVSALKEEGVVSLREQWEEAIVARCCSGKNIKKGGAAYRGCGKCNGCFARFAQVCNLIKSSSGVTDASCVMHWGSVYKSETYENHGFADWANMDEEEYAALMKPTSKQYYNTMFMLPCYRWLLRQGTLPSKPSEIMVVYGMALKSAALVLHCVYGGTSPAIAVDRHLSKAFKGLGWVHRDTRNDEEIAVEVQHWLPRHKWGSINTTVAGLMQLLKKKDTNPKVKRQAERLGISDLVDRLLLE